MNSMKILISDTELQSICLNLSVHVATQFLELKHQQFVQPVGQQLVQLNVTTGLCSQKGSVCLLETSFKMSRRRVFRD